MSSHLGNVDFERMYQGEVPEGAFGEEGGMPWDIGGPQPVVVELERSGRIAGDVLDAGCGLGGNSIFLAGEGYEATGFDASPSAIEQAGERARAVGAAPRFVVDDATRLDAVGTGFATVIDSALYHCLSGQQRDEYAAALHRVTRPGADLHLFCVADVDGAGIRFPMLVDKNDLHHHLGSQWDIHNITLADYTSTFTRDTLMRIQRSGATPAGFDIDINVDDVRVDDAGRVLLPVWHLHATRKG